MADHHSDTSQPADRVGVPGVLWDVREADGALRRGFEGPDEEGSRFRPRDHPVGAVSVRSASRDNARRNERLDRSFGEVPVVVDESASWRQHLTFGGAGIHRNRSGRKQNQGEHEPVDPAAVGPISDCHPALLQLPECGSVGERSREHRPEPGRTRCAR